MKTTIATLLMFAAAGVYAQATPAGLWKTIDDETKKERSQVRVVDNGGTLSARIEKLLDPTKQDSKCDKCSDERKDKPVIGMEIVRGVRQSTEDKAVWEGGEILDPNNGKVYKVRMKPMDGGQSLEVRGYIGAPLFGRTQTWLRVE